jgi:hypothetical protein
VAIHASIPGIVLMRILLGIPWLFAPLFIACAIAGQLAWRAPATTPDETRGRGRASGRPDGSE